MDSIKNIINDIRTATGTQFSNSTLNLHEPSFYGTKVKKYLNECIDSAWVSSSGKWVNKFESQLCLRTKSVNSIAVTNGTDGLRLALHIVGVKNDHEVLLPSLTFVATANAISHLGAIPHFVDIEERTFGICPDLLEDYLSRNAFLKNGIAYNKKTQRRISAIIPVHIFGIPSRIKEIVSVAKIWNIKVVEDAAEALGSFSGKVHCGLIGDIGVLSFNGNKIVTCGGGGALITNNSKYAQKAKHLSTTAKIPHEYDLMHDEIAWNDRLPNINAALGVAQLEVFDSIQYKKELLANRYEKCFSNKYPFKLIKPRPKDKTNFWLNTIQITEKKLSNAKSLREKILIKCRNENIFLRPVWKPLHKLKMYRNNPRSNMKNTLTASYSLINLPSSYSLMDKK